jgi:very-short-patch-repair endonuclease
VVEADGSQHLAGEGAARDSERAAYLTKLRVRTLRFTDREILNEREGVLTRILAAVERPSP